MTSSIAVVMMKCFFSHNVL